MFWSWVWIFDLSSDWKRSQSALSNFHFFLVVIELAVGHERKMGKWSPKRESSETKKLKKDAIEGDERARSILLNVPLGEK